MNLTQNQVKVLSQHLTFIMQKSPFINVSCVGEETYSLMRFGVTHHSPTGYEGFDHLVTNKSRIYTVNQAINFIETHHQAGYPTIVLMRGYKLTPRPHNYSNDWYNIQSCDIEINGEELAIRF